MDGLKKTLDNLSAQMKFGQDRLAEIMKNVQNIVANELASIKEDLVSVEDVIEEKLSDMENRVDCVENKIDKIEENLEKKVEEKFELFEKKMSEMPVKEDSESVFSATRTTIRLSTYDGKSSWQVYKMQFSLVADANGWDPVAKAVHLVASLRDNAAEILETISEDQRYNFEALSKALELRFVEKCTKEYSRLQLKSRYQGSSENLQELAADIQRLTHLAFSYCPFETRQDLALESSENLQELAADIQRLTHLAFSYCPFETRQDLALESSENLQDLAADIQRLTHLAFYIKDTGSALVYALKIEAAKQASRKDGGNSFSPQSGN